MLHAYYPDVILTYLISTMHAVRSAPDSIYLADAQKGRLIFSWSSVTSNDCSALQYSIASDCGICPTVTNGTTTTCSDLQLSTNPIVCHFRVRSVACDLIGNPSSPVSVTLKGNNYGNKIKTYNYYYNNVAHVIAMRLLIKVYVTYTDQTFL